MLPGQPPSGETIDAVLIVDPSDLTHALVRDVLGRHGYRTLHAQSTAEAVDLIRSEAISAVVTESADDRVDGFQIVGELRTHLRQRRVPVVFYTAWYTVADDDRLQSIQPATVLRKDGDVAALAEAVDHALGVALPEAVAATI